MLTYKSRFELFIFGIFIFVDSVIMDCIFHEVEKTFYVLDIMSWNNNLTYDSDVS